MLSVCQCYRQRNRSWILYVYEVFVLSFRELVSRVRNLVQIYGQFSKRKNYSIEKDELFSDRSNKNSSISGML